MLSWLAVLTAAVVAWGMTEGVRGWALARGWVDQPNERKVHRQPVPRLGGVGIFAGFLVGFLLCSLEGTLGSPSSWAILLGAAWLMLAGAVDDVRGLSPGLKLFLQGGAAVIALAGGVRVEGFSPPWGGGWVALGGWGWPLTVLWIVGLVNALNWIDGLDGLAGGVTLLASITLTLAAQATGRGEAAQAMLLLGASTFGFLLHNFHPARIFMGDSGSMMLGYILATVSVVGVMKTATVMALALPIFVLAVPIVDGVATILRRLRRGRPIYLADREHLHHRLLQAGLSHPEAVLVLYLLSGVFCMVGLMLGRLWRETVIFFITLLLLVLGSSVRYSRLPSSQEGR